MDKRSWHKHHPQKVTSFIRSNRFMGTNFMEEELIGGRGKCEYCGEIVNNVSYHEAIECLKRPLISGELIPEKIENGPIVKQDITESS